MKWNAFVNEMELNKNAIMSRLASWLRLKSAAQHVLHRNQAVRQSITCLHACVRACVYFVCSHTRCRFFLMSFPN